MTQLSNEEKLRQGIKKLLGDHKGPTEDLKKGEFRSFSDLHLNDIKLPNISNESISVFEMPIKIVPPFIAKSPIVCFSHSPLNSGNLKWGTSLIIFL